MVILECNHFMLLSYLAELKILLAEVVLDQIGLS